ncbi:hypothetical protein D9M71_455140 [compost metagenome]
MQEHRVGAQVSDALHQFSEVDVLLRRIRVVNVVQINMHNAHDEIRLHVDDTVGETLAVRIRSNEKARAAHQVVECVETVVQGQRHLIALFVDHRQRGAVRHSVWPDPNPWLVAGGLADFLRDGRNVGANSLLKFSLGFVAASRRVVPARGGGRLQVALRVGQHTFVIGVGVRSDFHQTRLGDFPDLIPGQEVRTLARCPGEIHRLVQRCVDPGPDRRQQGMPVVGAQHRHHAGIKA